MLTILQAKTDTQINDARRLFREYEEWLDLDLCFQGFEDELAGLPGRYAPPAGRLLLAYHEKRLAGCIALRKLDQGVSEMKRLFVRPEFRGKQIGERLVKHVIDCARVLGYKRLMLDTYPAKMAKAVSLYHSQGFTPTGAYYDNPSKDVLFMELAL